MMAHDLGITANVIHRVFFLKFGSGTATAFTVEVDGREYLITAKHAVVSFVENDSIELYSNNAWVKFHPKLVGHCDGDCDISVFALPRRLTPDNLPMEVSSDGVFYGQTAYFLGFPYGLIGKLTLGTDGFPLPFVKRATISLFDGSVLYLDGHNNAGFSGGPVVFREANKPDLRVAAVISGFRAVREPVYSGKSTTPLTVVDNTGIIIAHKVDVAVKLIRSNPIGFEVSTSGVKTK